MIDEIKEVILFWTRTYSLFVIAFVGILMALIIKGEILLVVTMVVYLLSGIAMAIHKTKVEKK